MRKLELRKEAKARKQMKLQTKKNRASAPATAAMQSCQHSNWPVSSGGLTRFDFDSEGMSDNEWSTGFGREGREIKDVDPLREFEPHYSHHNKQAADKKEARLLQQQQQQQQQRQHQRHDSPHREKVRSGGGSSWDAAWQEDGQQATAVQQWNDTFEERYVSHRREQKSRQPQHAPRFDYGHELSGDVIGGEYERMLARQHLQQEPKVEWGEDSQKRSSRSRKQSPGDRKHSHKSAGGGRVGADRPRISRPKSATASTFSRRHQNQANRAAHHRHGPW